MVPETSSRAGNGRRAVMLGCALLPALAWQVARAAPGALLTLVEGDAVVIDGVRRLAAVPGLRLSPTAIVQTGPNTALLRIEWPGQGMVDLGPATRAMVSPANFRSRRGHPPAAYLLQGWAKLEGTATAPCGGLVALRFELLPVGGAAVVWVAGQEDFVFAETEAQNVLERPSGAPYGISAGALYSMGGQVAPRPAPDWLQRVPRAFRDAIPPRAARLQGRAVEATVLAPPSYADLAPWLTGEPELRRDFPRRFASLAQDAGFRRAVQARLPAHPEWAPVLNPPR